MNPTRRPLDANWQHAPTSHLRYWLQGGGLFVAMGALYLVLMQVGFFHWLLANGALFAALWWLPRRWWPWLCAATIVARHVNGMIVALHTGDILDGFLGYWPGPIQYVLGNVLEPFLVMSGVLVLRRLPLPPVGPMPPERFVPLLLGGLVAGLMVAGKDLAYVLSEGRVGDIRGNLRGNYAALGGPDDVAILGTFFVSHALGTAIAVLLVAPLVPWLATPAHRSGSAAILRNALLWFVPAVAMYLFVALNLPGSRLSELLRVLLLVGTVVFAMRHGWRGALLSTLAISVVVALEDHLGRPAYDPIRMQAYLGIVGTMGLLLGASMDNLRQQAATLRDARERSDLLARDLYLAAARNLHTEERERRRLASELHDEFGQNLTALQTHLKLAERDFDVAGRPAALAPLFELSSAMRQNISGVLEALRPAALDQMGLYAAIECGAVRRLAEDAGLEFQTELAGDARLLCGFSDTQVIAAYRLVQEAVTNVVRHARASRCSVRLRAEQRNGLLWLFIDVRDDGIGGADCFLQGRGLTTMRDRVVALGGRLHVGELRPGSRIHALLRQPAG